MTLSPAAVQSQDHLSPEADGVAVPVPRRQAEERKQKFGFGVRFPTSCGSHLPADSAAPQAGTEGRVHNTTFSL